MYFSEDRDVDILSFFPLSLSLIDALTTDIYFQIGITGNTKTRIDTQTHRLNLILSPNRYRVKKKLKYVDLGVSIGVESAIFHLLA